MIIRKLYFLVKCECLNNYFKRETRILNCHIKMFMNLPCHDHDVGLGPNPKCIHNTNIRLRRVRVM